LVGMRYQHQLCYLLAGTIGTAVLFGSPSKHHLPDQVQESFTISANNNNAGVTLSPTMQFDLAASPTEKHLVPVNADLPHFLAHPYSGNENISNLIRS